MTVEEKWKWRHQCDCVGVVCKCEGSKRVNIQTIGSGICKRRGRKIVESCTHRTKWMVREKEMNCYYVFLCRFVTRDTEKSVVTGKAMVLILLTVMT